MKKDILKIAGVKSEAEFYRKYPTEEAFKKAFPKEFKKAAMGASMVKKQLNQLTDFGNPPQAQVGINQQGTNPQYPYVQYNPANPMAGITNPYGGSTMNNTTYNRDTGMIGSDTGQVSMADTRNIGFTDSGNKTLKNLNANDIQSGVQMTSTIGKNVQKIGSAIKQKKEAKKLRAVLPVVMEASAIRPEQQKRRYVRPEDMAFGTQQMGQAYGTSASNQFLQMKQGGRIGGNPTEIQNMYNPGDIYSDMGYEPLSDSDIVKQYRRGGHVPKADMGAAAAMAAIQEGINMGGDIASGIINIGTKRINKQNEKMLGQTAFQSGMQDLQQGQYGGFMKDGGEVGLKYLSHDWQPQVITQFGGYDMKDLLRDDPTMDTLRAGGHLKNYTAPSARAMSTERPDYFAMGGQLKTTWGGDAETISQNPYLPGTGETVVFRGKSHEESDGKGHTGIGVKYGGGAKDSYTDYAEYGTEQAGADVEVERNETGVELPDSETGGVSLTVNGNMIAPSYVLSEIGEENNKKFKGKKFKYIDKEFAKQEAKQNKKVEKGLKLIDSVDGDNPFDLLKMNSGKAMVYGGDATLKTIADKRIGLAGGQNSILKTAEEMGIESDALSKGRIKPIKDSDMAKFGAKMQTAQVGVQQPDNSYSSSMSPLDTRWNKYLPDRTPSILSPYRSIEDYMAANPINLEEIVIQGKKKQGTTTTEEKPEKFDWMNILRQAQPYLTPSNQMGLEAAQLMPEMLAMATNQLEPVQAQTFQPLLEQPYSVSFQDQLNANQADFNAMQRVMGYNPAAASTLAAQKYAANSAVLGQQSRINQEMQMGAFNRNRGVLNDATLKNLAILDQQYARQAQAKSATKAQAQAALSSIADKIAKNKLENRTLGVYENMYNYRFGPRGRAINANAPADFNMQGSTASSAGEKGQLAPGMEFTYDANRNIIGARKTPKGDAETGRNGLIVKAIKNL